MSDPWVEAMRDGDVAGCLRINDAVLARRRAAGAAFDDPTAPYHARFVWDGRPVDGARVLVRCYHGLGDTLMAARFLAPLARRARAVAVEAPPPLVALLGLVARAAGSDLAVIPFDHARPLPPSEVDVEITELGHALRLGPGEAPPVRPDVPARALPPGAVGLCWRAGEWLPARSVPFELLAPILRRATGRVPVPLQLGPALDAARAAHPEVFAHAPAAADEDVARTASLLAGLPLVVTVDTMVAHLSLLLDRPTIVLLRADADWRWGRPGRPSPWYPDAVMFRQAAEGDWTGPLAALAARLIPAAG